MYNQEYSQFMMLINFLFAVVIQICIHEIFISAPGIEEKIEWKL